ncbi:MULTISPECIES: DNA polymerase III subunit gamma/tau [unclassified Cyanobium]|uniref:DNA polymerase III subunit gamma/tau n=1 Tax=unclassified Cyanobium TaxID=2627006 RepID=UPI0020CC1322|nr:MULTISPECIES: DNA polymerase III subunit gamma/tau [unclassified Cyanobium]MCP9834386.1 DNA polymerase III subunit gamma/tau [Cyanobium sp. La Preciosa 7G6]MCP9937242.1 DNA polymerase III subunit gamma/tau [Cyanobium sp. Aljojuca 7A6]
MVQAYEPLHHKYRPQRFDQLVGQKAVADTLSQALLQNRIAPAYLFSGPRGTGKTSSARILARSLNCLASPGPTPEPCGRCQLCTDIAAGNALDVIEIDAASNTGVDNIRELIERSRFAPVQARWKVYVVDECHMLSTAAFNALLKTLEEPPPRVVFVLATTDPQRVLPTILSRCQRFDFRRIPLKALEGHLHWIAAEESIGITPEALHLVAQRSQGGLRDAESLLDQLSLLPAPIAADAVWDLLGAVPDQELLRLADAMAAADPLQLVEGCRELLDRGREPAAVLQGLVSLLRDLLLAGVAPDRLELTSVSPELRPQLPDVARQIGKARLLRWQSQLKGSEQQLRHSVQPRLWLEVLLLGLLAEPAPVAPSPTDPVPARAEVQRSVHSVAPGPAEAEPPAASAMASTAAPGTTPDVAPVVAAPSNDNLVELWQQILAGLELPSTRMLLSQQAQLLRLDDRRAVVRVAGTWMAMVQSRLPLLEKAVASALGSPRQLTLEAGGDAPGAQAPPVPVSPPARPAPAATALPAPGTSITSPPVADRHPPPPAAGERPDEARAAAAAMPAAIDAQASRLAEFFNGEVISGINGDAELL